MIFDETGHRLNRTLYYSFGFEGKARAPLGQFASLDYFFGNGDIVNADAIEKNTPPLRKLNPLCQGKEAVAALRFRPKVLKPGGQAHYCLITGIADSSRVMRRTFRVLNTPAKVKRQLELTQEYWLNYLGGIEYDFKDHRFNNWLRWVKLQPRLRKLFGCSFLPHFDYGKGGRGWRDLWQDTLALLLHEPEQTSEMILNNLKGVRIDGSNATIIGPDGSFLSDRNRINRVWMDHGIWPYLSLRLYLNRTGDISILTKSIPYFKDHLLSRGKATDSRPNEKDYRLRTKTGPIYTGTVLEHVLFEILVPFFNAGSHNAILLENADWNDGLDMAAERGESVTFSFMYAHHLRDICGWLTRLKKYTKTVSLLSELTLLLEGRGQPVNYDDYRSKQERLATFFEKTKNIAGSKVKIPIDELIADLQKKAMHLTQWLRRHEWLREGFYNGYYDNLGRRVEGKRGGRVRMMLASQVFALMSGTATEAQTQKIWRSVKKYLFDKHLGGFRLNTDFGSCYLELGRAFGFAYGDKENGAFFNHMVVMLAHALYRQGFIKQAHEALFSIYALATQPKAKLYPLIPEYFNNEGRGLYLYLTGSASWYLYTLFQETLGIQFCCGDLVIEPKLVSSQFKKNTITVRFPYAGKTILVEYIKMPAAHNILRIHRATWEDREITIIQNRCAISRASIEKNKAQNLHLAVYLA